MIARVHIFLPYALSVTEGEEFSVYEYGIDGYRVRIFPPKRSERADSYVEMENMTINGVKAFHADVLRIDFQKEEFDRTEGSQDPPFELIQDVANNFLSRLRYVTGGSRVKLIELPSTSWSLKYVNDDGSELSEQDGQIRGLEARKWRFSFIAINKEVWENIHSIAPNYNIPVWKNILLDADGILPEVGPAIVLIFTALEVFISKTLDDIAATGKVNDELWKWINDRTHYTKEPSIAEKYDFLSRNLLGKSLKEDNKLWESFQNLRTARNSFVHEGIAMIGKGIVTEEKARSFIGEANKIIDFIKEELPEELRWPEFKHEMKINFTKTIIKPDDEK